MNGEPSLTTFAQTLMGNNGLRPEIDPYELEFYKMLHGDIKDVVYNTLSLPDRRAHGIFFSGPEWAKTLCSKINADEWTRFVDPSVGTGDLLLEICNNFPLKSSFSKTIVSWSKCLIAVDLRASFLQIAWIRIQKLALDRHRQKNPKIRGYLLPLPGSFMVGDSLKLNLGLKKGDCVIMNPPYQRIVAASDSFVGKGKRSAAALHVENVVLKSPPGVGIVALLPDVLRSGSSYNKFRSEVFQRAEIKSFNPFGIFGSDADIDVAVLVGVTKTKKIIKNTVEAKKNAILADKFDVRVGPVVPHRTEMRGNSHAYLTVKNAVIGSEITEVNETAEFSARLERGPFVIVRRTSSPADKKRARATLVSAVTDFYVENHLLIIRPLDNSIAACKELMKVLQDDRTDEWLNIHIRCRHLTVGALKALPWLEQL